jgi:hypothetical protein
MLKQTEEQKAERRRLQESNRSSDKDRTAHEKGRGKKARKVTSKGSAISLSSAISRHDPDNEQFDKAVAEFHAGSDRVAAIMGAALIENNLVSAISAALEDSSNRNALFYDQGAPFGTLKAKIVAGRALGLFNDKVTADLDVIREIRNQFAHSLLSIDFEHPLISAACDRLTGHQFHTVRDREVSKSRLLFERACWSISMGMLVKSNSLMENKIKDFDKLVTQSLENSWDIPSTNALITIALQRGDDDVESDIASSEIAIED